MGNNNRQQQNRGEQNAREFFTLGEHALGAKRYRFRYDGRTYRILERTVSASGEESEEILLLEEAEARTAYDAWNRIKRPERFGLGG
jgi:hypothetical protein